MKMQIDMIDEKKRGEEEEERGAVDRKRELERGGVGRSEMKVEERRGKRKMGEEIGRERRTEEEREEIGTQ